MKDAGRRSQRGLRQGKSLMHRIGPMFYVLAGGFLLGLLLNAAAMVYTRHEQRQYADRAVQISADAVERELSAMTRSQAKMVIDYTMGEGTLSEPLSLILYSPEGSVAFQRGKQQLRNAFSVDYLEYASFFHFYFYFPAQNRYIAANGDETEGTGAEMAFAEREVHRLSEQGEENFAQNDGWSSVSDGKTVYLMKQLHYQEIYFGYWLRADDLAFFIQNSSTEEEQGSLMLLDRSEQVLGTAGQTARNGFKVETAFEKLPFILCEFVPVSGGFQNILLLQVLVVAVTAACMFGVLWYFRHTVRDVIRPIREFCEGLASYGGEKLPELDSAEILELEQADRQFRYLAEQIKHLKISLYEKQMEQQREVIEFMKLQIRPHFFLNCLNLAYNMVELKKYEECRELLRLTSDYFRYLLKSDMRMERISDELSYVRSYLRIQSIRYRKSFAYDIEQDPETADCYIPPLIIQGFVENAVKNTAALERPVEISVTVMEELENTVPVIHIFITDTGNGFPEDVLRQLQEGKPLQRKDGTGIGINNSMKRLEYHFKEKFHIQFYNSPLGGAVVALTIPVCKKPKQKQ